VTRTPLSRSKACY